MNIELQDTKKSFPIILFWGSIWGLVEATLGYYLHTLHYRVPTGSIFFPIAYYILNKVYKESGSKKAIIYTACIAASIKLINLSMSLAPIKTLNPASSIILQGLTVYMFQELIVTRNKPVKLGISTAMSISWRIGYYLLALLIFIPLGLVGNKEIFNKARVIDFFIVNSIINSILIYTVSRIKFGHGKEKARLSYSIPSSLGIYLLALLVQWKL